MYIHRNILYMTKRKLEMLIEYTNTHAQFSKHKVDSTTYSMHAVKLISESCMSV